MTKTKNNIRISPASLEIIAEFKRRAKQLERIKQQQLLELRPQTDLRQRDALNRCKQGHETG